MEQPNASAKVAFYQFSFLLLDKLFIGTPLLFIVCFQSISSLIKAYQMIINFFQLGTYLSSSINLITHWTIFMETIPMPSFLPTLQFSISNFLQFLSSTSTSSANCRYLHCRREKTLDSPSMERSILISFLWALAYDKS